MEGEEAQARLLLDLMERGEAREVPEPWVVGPPEDDGGGWVCCRLTLDAGVFKLLRVAHEDEDRDVFLLSALRLGDSFVISRYEEVLDLDEAEHGPDAHVFGDGRSHAVRPGFLFQLRPLEAPGARARGYELVARHCAPCDAAHGYRCEPCGAPAPAADDSREDCRVCGAPRGAPPCARASLAAVFHSMSRPSGSAPEFRHLRLHVPPADGPTWCARSDRARAGPQPRPLAKFQSRLPSVDERGNLRLTFPLDRRSRPSKRNMLVEGAAGPVLQLGKARSGRYTLDFRAPLSAAQAFAVALSAFAWR